MAITGPGQPLDYRRRARAGLNDDPAGLAGVAEWIAGSVGEETPWHLARFQPAYKLGDLHATPALTLAEAYRVAR